MNLKVNYLNFASTQRPLQSKSSPQEKNITPELTLENTYSALLHGIFGKGIEDKIPTEKDKTNE